MKPDFNDKYKLNALEPPIVMFRRQLAFSVASSSAEVYIFFMKIIVLAFVLGLIALMLAGCSGSSPQPLRNSPPREIASFSKAAPDTDWIFAPPQVESLPPSRADQPALLDPRTNLRYEPYIYKRSQPVLPSDRSPEEKSGGVIAGFRVQIFSGRDYSAAQKMKADAEAALNAPIYLIFVAPQYKIRVGNFAERIDAENLCALAQSLGFKDAWVVSSQVEVSP